jgi:mRNA interferase MazF
MTTAVTGRQSDRAILTRTKLGGVVLADQVKNIDWRVRKAGFICKLPREKRPKS